MSDGGHVVLAPPPGPLRTARPGPTPGRCPLCGRQGCPCLAPGTLLADRYRVERELGRGSSKQVLLVTDVLLERQVALCLSRERGAEQLRRMRREAALTARIEAQGRGRVVVVHDVGELAGVPYLIAQYLAGGSLAARLRAGPVPMAQALQIGEDVARALAQVHAAGLVHRDVTPSNAYQTAEGETVLGDLGLAVPLHDPGEPAGVVAGTAGYLAPEQAYGAPPDQRGDLYSLGAVLWEVLCSRPLPAARGGVPAPPPSQHRDGVPPALDALVTALLAADPEDRPDARWTADALAALRRRAAPDRASRDAVPLVGRDDELAVLRTALAESRSGRGGSVLVLGEPGVGKTRLVAELALEAAADGVLVLRGRAPDGEGVPAYWPWTQVLRDAVQQLGPVTLRAAAGGGGDVLWPLLPELFDAGAGSPSTLLGDAARLRLVDGVGRLLRTLGGQRPLLLLLDDLHWADPATLALTRYLCREVPAGRILLVGLARDDDATSATPLGRLVGAAGRSVLLGGLGLGPTAELVDQLAGGPVGTTALRTLHDRSEGNPFFVGELVRLLLAEQRTPGRPVEPGRTLPRGVREVLGRRLELVSAGCVELLRTGSVLGRVVPLALLADVVGRPAAELLPELDEAVASRLLAPRPGVPVSYGFPHALVQDVLYEGLSTRERAELHSRAGQALLERHPDGRDDRAAELAAHFVRAAVVTDPEPAVLWSVRAARRARTAGAWEEEAAHLERALELAGPRVAVAGVPDRGELLLELGEARCRTGCTEAGRTSFQSAADLALVAGDADLLARAALGYGTGLGGFGFAEHADGVLLSLLEEALAGLDGGDSPLRVRVLSRLATELYFTPFRSRRLELSSQALAMARRLGDRQVELVALYSRTWALLGPDGVQERRAIADRVLGLALSLGDDEMVLRARHLRLNLFLEAGERDRAESEVDGLRALAETLRLPVPRWQVRVSEAMLALLDGDAERADALAHEAVALGGRGHPEMASVVFGAQLLVARWQQGRLDEVLESARSFADAYPHAPAWRAGLAFLYAELDRPQAGQAELDVLAAREFADLPRDGNFLTAAALAAMAASRLRDRPRCRLLLQALEPYADRHVVVAAGAAVLTSVEQVLGLLTTALGDPDAGLAHLDRAGAAHRSCRAEGLLVWTAVEQVLALLERGGVGDRSRAEQLAAGADRDAKRLGASALAARLHAAVPALDDGCPVTVLLTDVAGSTSLTERLGELVVHQLLAEHRTLARELAEARGGWAVKSLGDGVLLVFPRAGPAVEVAVALQQQTQGLALRLGMHTGTVLREGGSVYGRTLVLAFRIADRARAGEVLLSQQAARAAALELPGLALDRARRLRLKGFADPVPVHRLLWRDPGRDAGSGDPAG